MAIIIKQDWGEVVLGCKVCTLVIMSRDRNSSTFRQKKGFSSQFMYTCDLAWETSYVGCVGECRLYTENNFTRKNGFAIWLNLNTFANMRKG